MTRHKISNVGLISAQHHRENQNPQGVNRDTHYQVCPKTVLNVTNNTASNRVAQEVGCAAVQTIVDSRSFPDSYNHSTVAIEATGLDKSAAGPTVVADNTASNFVAPAVQTSVSTDLTVEQSSNKSFLDNYNRSYIAREATILTRNADKQTDGYQLLPCQGRFFGHHPNLELPPSKCLLGCIFLIVEYDRCPNTINEVPTWKKIILDHGGEIESYYTSRLTHILCRTQRHRLVKLGLRDDKRCITAYWLSDVIIKQHLIPPLYALHFPTSFGEEKPCHKMLISLTNFEGEERNRVKFMIELTGAQVTSYFSVHNDILVTRKYEGKKVKKARDTNRPIVNVQWLNEIFFGNLTCLHEPEYYKFQQFNLNDPFRVDFNLVRNLMEAWIIPINVTRKMYDGVRNNLVPIKRKQPRPCLPHFIDQDNNDSSMAAVKITNINPPLNENRPCVMLSGFGLGKEEQRMVLLLGGTIAKHYSDATHLVMKEFVRTTTFLCCISTVKHIVTIDWLKDSFIQHTFLDEAIYGVEEISVDQKVTCKVHEVLSNPNRHELFKEKIFYVTPGVTRPSVFVIRQIIESAGGTVEKQRRSLRAIQKLEPNSYIVIACNNDLHLIDDLITASCGIYSSELVLSAVMTQCINYEMA